MISHDPLKIIVDEYRNKTCNTNQTVFWKEDKSDIVRICDPKVTIISTDEYENLTIEISMDAEGERLFNVTIEPCDTLVKGEENKNMKAEQITYWVYVGVGVSVLSIIITLSVAATVRARRKKKEKIFIDQNIVYGDEEYYEGSNITDKNTCYD